MYACMHALLELGGYGGGSSRSKRTWRKQRLHTWLLLLLLLLLLERPHVAFPECKETIHRSHIHATDSSGIYI
jgi:hypothetical protein